MEIKDYGQLSADMISKVMGWTNSLNRGNAIPLDDSSIHNSYADAVKYINEAKTAYEGQIIAVKNNGAQEVYVVDKTATDGLRKLATGGDADKLVKILEAKIYGGTVDGVTYPGSLSGDENSVLSVGYEAAKSLLSEVSATLSDALSTEADTRATDDLTLSNAITAEIERATQAEADVLSTAKAYADEVGRNIISGAPEAYDTLKEIADWISGDVTGTAALIDRVATNESNIATLSDDLATLSNDLASETERATQAESDLSDALTAEIERAETAEADISSAVDSKIKVQDGAAAEALSVETLTIHKIGQADYEKLLVDNAVVDTDLYIVSSEYLNGYGQQAKNIADGTDDADAVNVKQLKAVSADLQKQIDEAVGEGIEELSTNIFGKGALKDQLSAAISGEIERATKAESDLDDALTTEIQTRAAGDLDLSNAITAETDARVAAEQRLNSAIEAEAQTRAADDLVLSNAITAEIQTRAADDLYLSAAISSEIKARQDADKAQDDALSAWKDLVGLSAANGTADGQVVTWGQVKDITSAMHFRDAITSSTETPIASALAAVADPKKGDVVIDTTTSKEYVYTGSEWRELGDESMYLKNAEFENFLTGTYQPFTADVELSVGNLKTDLDELSGKVEDLSGEVADNKAAIEATVAAEVARATAAEKAVDDKVNELSTYTHALSVSQLVWDIDLINCGNASGF